MNQGFTSVPFKTDSGLSQINGVAKFSSAGIVLEFEAKLFGLITSGIKEVRLPLSEILDLKFKKGVFKRGAKIEIRMKSFAAMKEVPNSDGKITLKLVADDFDRAKQAAEKLQKDLPDHTESLPPPHTPIGQLFEEESKDETRSLKKE